MRSFLILTFIATTLAVWAAPTDLIDQHELGGASDLASGAKVAAWIPSACRQMIIVESRDWRSSHAAITRFSRADAVTPWRQAGQAAPALIGKRGMGWAAGIMDVSKRAGPRKLEGDLRSPAGVFHLGAVFCRTSSCKTQIPIIQITPQTEAIDDPHSRHYGQIVDRDKIAVPDWRSSEHMARVNDYALGVTVDANPARKPGAGSCIFLHLWMGKRMGTSGCTALRSADLTELVQWLDATKDPILVQMPAGGVME